MHIVVLLQDILEMTAPTAPGPKQHCGEFVEDGRHFGTLLANLRKFASRNRTARGGAVPCFYG
jgi:hypothetical protein